MTNTDDINPENQTSATKKKNWLKRIGVAGFLFFLIKGILWLVVGKAFLTWIGCH